MKQEQNTDTSVGQAVNADAVVSAPLPCPFCGATPTLKYWDDDERDSCRYQCETCGCSLLWECRPYEALSEWNQRKNCKTFCRLFAEAQLTREYEVAKCKLCKGLKP